MFKFFTTTGFLLILMSSPRFATATTGGHLNVTMLGFSPDSKHFVMAVLGTDNGIGAARAKIMIVNVATNRCVHNGCYKARGTVGNLRTEEDVLNEVLRKTWRLRSELQLTPPQGFWAKGHFDFRENDASTAVYNHVHQKIYVRLLQKVKEDEVKASMQLEVSRNNIKKTLDSLENYRDSTLEYKLDESLFISPDGKGFAFLIKVVSLDGWYDFIVQTVAF